MGSMTSCGVHADRTLTCWGPQSGESLDYGTVATANADGGSDFVDITMGIWHACGLRESGELTC